MNQHDIDEMIELLKKDENSKLRKQLAAIVVSVIEEDYALRNKIVALANRGGGSEQIGYE
jgi:hypothetical protein